MIGPKAMPRRAPEHQPDLLSDWRTGILLGKYLVFPMAKVWKIDGRMNAEQIHNFKVLMLENTL